MNVWIDAHKSADDSGRWHVNRDLDQLGRLLDDANLDRHRERIRHALRQRANYDGHELDFDAPA